MNHLNLKPSTCEGCALVKLGSGFQRCTGSGANHILLVGDVPWYGLPKGQLERFTRRWGIDLNLFGMHSLVSCTPPGYRLGWQPYEGPAITHCGANLARTIDELQPKVIVPMGETALRFVLNESKLLRHRGRVYQKDGHFIVPTFHPRDLLPVVVDKTKSVFEGRAAVLSNPARFTGLLIKDLALALRVAREGFVFEEGNYLCDPSEVEFSAWANDFEQALASEPTLMLSWDIETPYKLKAKDDDEIDEAERDKQIIRISFSCRPGTGVSVEWSPRFLPTIRRLLAARCIHVGWNCDSFDTPLVRAQGVEIHGEVHDYMWGFHLIESDLPKGLEFVSSLFTKLRPWKHLSNLEPARYSAIDADAALQNAIGIRQRLEVNGQMDLFLRHVVKLDPILAEAGARGSFIWLAKQAELTQRMTAEKVRLMAAVQLAVPDSVRPRKRFKKLPAAEGRRFAAVAAIGKVKRCTVCGDLGVKAASHFKGGKKNVCKAAGATIETIEGAVTEWDEILDFNPNSSQQLISYMKLFDHPIGRNKQDREKQSADALHLARLVKRYKDDHPIYGLTIDIHKVAKALSTYVEGFAPDAAGLIHTTYDHTPSTWRLASKNVNLQNVGKSETNPWAKEAREQIIARPGCVFVQADSSAIEAVFVGHFMGSAAYIALARKGVHAYLACLSLGWDFTVENIARVKAEEKKLYRICKVVVHGTGFGMGPGLMVTNNPDLFTTRSVAEQWQQRLFDAVPGLEKWQTATRIRAHKDTYLTNPWGHRHSFFAVLNVEQDGTYTLGTDANRAVAYLPQSSAGSFMCDNLVRIGDTWLRDYLPAHVSVHDGYCVEVPLAREDEARILLGQILTRPIAEMGGLQIGCETERGTNWAHMDSTGVISIAA